MSSPPGSTKSSRSDVRRSRYDHTCNAVRGMNVALVSINWEQEGSSLPDLKEAHRRIVAGGRPSKVNHPTSAHVARQIAEPRSKNIERVLNPLHTK